MIVTRLGENDARKLQTLNDLFGEVFDDSESYQTNRPSESYLIEYLQSRSHIVLVAENYGEIIGGLVAYVLHKFEQNRKEVYVYDLAVATNAQQQGVGRKLMAEVRRIAKEEGAYVVFVQADKDDAAVHFYRALNPKEESATLNFDFNI